MTPPAAVVDRLLVRLKQVRDLLGQELLALDASARFADALDSMGFVEYLALIAEDYGLSVEAIERAAGRHYGSVVELAAALDAAGLRLDESRSSLSATSEQPTTHTKPMGWLSATAVRLPTHRQPASAINKVLRRPPGWLEKHAGIETRCLWTDEDPPDAAAGAAQDCLDQAGLPAAALGAILVTSEAPPCYPGVAAALHTRMGLASNIVALEIGGACTGFLAALWTACRLLADSAVVLIIAIEAPSRWLSLSPTPAGEAAALLGDAATACLLTARPMTAHTLSLRDIQLGSDASTGSLLRIKHELGGGILLHMEGIPLAHRTVWILSDAVRQQSERYGLSLHQLAGVVLHGGNGRMPALLARRLKLSLDQVWSDTAQTGNLGSASLPVAWSLHHRSISAPVIWAAIGAGLQWGVALFEGPA